MITPDAYASALLEVAKDQGQLDTVEEELFRVARTLEANDGLLWVLSDQSVPVEARQATLAQLLEGKVSPITAQLAAWVVGENQALDLPEIIDRLVARAADERNEYVAEVRVAEPLDADRLERLRQGLTRTLGREVVVRTVIDPSVIGGVVARVGDTIIDGTIGHRLEQLRRSMRTPARHAAADTTHEAG
ncbi:ATP synthase F1 subunit delta [Acidiferrimicrobium sp. IK]|uniref:ATP synthase F1 subunit delta n=1 Tax=Acidiferrimicrobium sp. IK TaxID=2871700 RepID=UPI0021CB8D9C|nr:ATP synthase F1 subunit delta [Acidiferrimicrobium sp. IK]MCU4186491.1 ATP synthase F1 subunit delta [Acidiferrimicrobium sp. IK]